MWDEKHSLGGAKALSGTTISSLHFPIIILLLTISLPSITLSGLYNNSSFFPNGLCPNKDKMHWKIWKLSFIFVEFGEEKDLFYLDTDISLSIDIKTSPLTFIMFFFVWRYGRLTKAQTTTL